MDPTNLNPEIYQTVFENNNIRILDAQWWPGQKDEEHSHPRRTIYALTNFNLTYHLADGSTKEIKGMERSIMQHEQIEALSIENSGSAYTRLLIVEIKS